MRTRLFVTAALSLKLFAEPSSFASKYEAIRKLPEIYSVRNFGAVGDGRTDDTAAFTAAINAASDHSIVAIPNGTYILSGIQPKSNVYFRCNGATLKLKAKSSMPILRYARTTHDTGLLGTCVLDGNRTNQRPGDLFGLHIRENAYNLYFQNIFSQNNVSDGVLIGHDGTPHDIYFENLMLDNNGRNGLSITSGRSLSFNSIVATNTNGDAPEMGIDLEPVYFSDVMEDIYFRNVVVADNHGVGMSINGYESGGQLQHLGVTVGQIDSHGNLAGLKLYDCWGVKFLSGVSHNNRNVGLFVEKNLQLTQFLNIDFYNNGQQGAFLPLSGQTVQTRDISFDGSRFFNNGTGGSGAYGLFMSSDNALLPISRISLYNVKAFDNQSVPTQQFGIVISNNVQSVQGNVTGHGNTNGLVAGNAETNLGGTLWVNEASEVSRSSSGAATILSGTGSPEGIVAAVVGSLFMRMDGGIGTSFYVKETGSGNTGWIAK